MTPMLHLDVSNKLVQNLKLIDASIGVGTEHAPPRMPLVGAEREFVTAVVQKAWPTVPPSTVRSPDTATEPSHALLQPHPGQHARPWLGPRDPARLGRDPAGRASARWHSLGLLR
jgi:hypothetical protein